MRRRRPYRTLAFRLIALYAIAVAFYVFGLSFVQAETDPLFRWRDLWIPRLNDVLRATYFFTVGASVGSFLNLVAWRLPRGGSVHGHSRCPRCLHSVRVRDNLPVFGWLLLGGRCRDCRLPISPRYPIVEAAVGISVAIVGTASIMRVNLPYDDFEGDLRPVWSFPVDNETLAILGFHILGLAIAWAIALIRIDRWPIPPRMTGFATLAILATLCMYPPAMVAPWQFSVPRGWPQSMLSGHWLDNGVQVMMRVLTSLVAAGFYARLLSRGLSPTADLKMDPLGSSSRRLLDLSVMLGVPALLVGWQALIGIVVVASLLARCCPSSFGNFRSWDRLGSLGLALVVVLTLQLTLWRVLVAGGIWPSESASRGVMLTWLVISLTIPSWLTEPIQNRTADVVSR